jgi:hypothetical protein
MAPANAEAERRDAESAAAVADLRDVAHTISRVAIRYEGTGNGARIRQSSAAQAARDTESAQAFFKLLDPDSAFFIDHHSSSAWRDTISA